MNAALQPSGRGEKESFNQLGLATQRFGSKLGPQLCEAPEAAVPLSPFAARDSTSAAAAAQEAAATGAREGAPQSHGRFIRKGPGPSSS